MVIPWVTLRDWYLSTCSRDVERPSATRGGELVPKETMQKYENKYNPLFGDQKKKCDSIRKSDTGIRIFQAK